MFEVVVRSSLHVGLPLRSVVQSTYESVHTSPVSLIITVSLGPPSPVEFTWVSASTLYAKFLE